MSATKQSIALAAAIAFCLPGCGPGQTRGVSSSSSTWNVIAKDPIPGIHKGATEFVTLNSGAGTGVTVVVWCADANGSKIHSSAGQAGAFSDVSFLLSDERQVGFRCETEDGLHATVTIADRTFDTTDGALFLISPHSKSTQIKQLDIDVTNFPKGAVAIRDFANEHPDVAAFFKEAKNNVSTERDESAMGR